MNRTVLTAAGMLSASTALLVDSAVKGTALLVLAAIAVIFLRRDSAATRHLVWLLAMVAILFVPALSALLPQWRVLPEWARISPQPGVVQRQAPSPARPAQRARELPRIADPTTVEPAPATAYQPAAEPPDSKSRAVAPQIIADSAAMGGKWSWRNALPFAWAIGFCVLILRLMAARLMLWNCERQGTVIRSSAPIGNATHDPIVMALEAACSQLGIGRPNRLLIHADKTIPVVWGILRSRLLLPAAARAWSGEQLRSVLLHELAHIRRRDTVAQLLVQVACALHWFNPLVWFAAWRLGVECERACDDLVLASGVRPSAYAGHLLEVVTDLSPVRWTQPCGLAMARKSSFEGRLIAVLSENLNRRGVPLTLAAIALAVALALAVPIAMLRAADEKPGASGQERESTRPKAGAKLEPGADEKLQWGASLNGLRAALVIRPAPGQPPAADMPELYLAVQNVSDAPIHLSDTIKAARNRYLMLRRNDETLFGIVLNEPTLADIMLQPREVVLLLMFRSDWKQDGRTEGSVFAEGLLKDPRQTLVAELNIEQAPAGAWTGKLKTGETSGAPAAGKPYPKNKSAQVFFRVWQERARANANIPGGLVGQLGDKVKELIQLNTGDAAGDKFAKSLAPFVPRFDAGRDWTPAQAVALLDDIAAISTIPLDAVTDEAVTRTIQTGAPLPRALANAPWGEALPNGLRMAWLLVPSAEHYRLGTPLKSRILVHNSGKNVVVFRTRTWHQSDRHQARDAGGAEIKVDSIDWTTIAPLVPFRLEPGEFVELSAAGIGVGANKNDEDWQGARVGSWVEAKEGDVVTFLPDRVPLSDWNQAPLLNGEPGWWLGFITARLNREMPMPADASERTLLLDRVVRELFGTTPTADETTTFVADRELKALDSLAQRLAHRPGMTPFTGALISGTTQFRVVAADPDAARKPRTASDPGRYTLGDNIRFVVSRRPDGTRIVNEGSIEFFSPDPTKPAPGQPYQIRLPDGYDTWSAAWLRDSTVLWVLREGDLRSYDFSNPAQVKETTYGEPARLDQVPKRVLDALRAALDLPGKRTLPPATPID